MAQDDGTGIAVVQVAEQQPQRAFLGIGAGVTRLSVAVQASLIAYADGMGIMVMNMGALSSVFRHVRYNSGSRCRSIRCDGCGHCGTAQNCSDGLLALRSSVE